MEPGLFVVKGLWRRGGILDESDYLSKLPVEHTDTEEHGVGSLMNFCLFHVTSVQFMLHLQHPKPPWAATVLILTRRLEWKPWSHTVLLVSWLLSLRRWWESSLVLCGGAVCSLSLLGELPFWVYSIVPSMVDGHLGCFQFGNILASLVGLWVPRCVCVQLLWPSKVVAAPPWG